MKDQSNKRAVIVGAFVFAGMIIFAAGILVLGGQKKSFMSSLQVVAVFQDIGGLAKGDNVWYSGVKVGTIKSIAFTGPHSIAVRMDIEKKSRDFIHKDVRAKVSSDGLVGNKIIALNGGTPEVPPVEDGDTIIVETAISTDEIMNTLQVNNKSLVEITGNLKEITKNIRNGQGTLGKLIADDAVYNNLEGTLATLQKTAANTQRLTEGLAAYTARLQNKGTLANDLVTDTVVFAKLRSTVTQLESVAQGVDSVVLNLKDASAGINENLRSTNTPAGVILNDEQTATSLKHTIGNLETSSQKLDENLEALKHNFLFRGYFRRKAKAEAKEKARLEKEAKKQQP
ncbi:MlaD family protein [Chitinophaga sp. GCM10012297]|uniref:MCE family protein n=1 Tax=Chitinophaga chungangae TaxID=2821488 RepID=A0ABS3YBQ5_9BACT|nr:MlaD family protein [Chitinophaga chungangae]MBO9152086.1 MCE family protein [Chitinophaga chungangae]